MKAKELRPYAEKLITLAKRDDGQLHARRQVAARHPDDPMVVKKLFDTLGPRFSSRPGGYTRILRLGPRKGDGAEMAIVELLGSEYKPEKKGGRTRPRRPRPRTEKTAKPEKTARPRKTKDEGEAGGAQEQAQGEGQEAEGRKKSDGAPPDVAGRPIHLGRRTRSAVAGSTRPGARRRGRGRPGR